MERLEGERLEDEEIEGPLREGQRHVRQRSLPFYFDTSIPRRGVEVQGEHAVDTDSDQE